MLRSFKSRLRKNPREDPPTVAADIDEEYVHDRGKKYIYNTESENITNQRVDEADWMEEQGELVSKTVY